MLLKAVSMSDPTDQTQQNMVAIRGILDQTAEIFQNYSADESTIVHQVQNMSYTTCNVSSIKVSA